MSQRYTSKIVLSTATLLAFGATVAFAQDTVKTRPRSQTRIPISKEAGGDIARIDTVKVFQTDTLRLTTQLPGRVDTVRVNNTVNHYDTVQVMKPMHLPGGLYFGVGGGVSAPNGALYKGNSAGPSAQAQLGWQGANNPLGVRFDVNYAQPGDDSQYAGTQGNPSIVNMNADLKLALPFFHHLDGNGPRFGLYAIGGGSYVLYKDLPIRLNPGVPGGVTAANIRVGPTDWEKNFGYNVGAGASLSWGHKELFLESRIIDFKTDITPLARQMPFVLGINLY